MREILFKGKRKDNGEWIEGSLITSINRAWISSEKTDSQRLRSISNTDAIWRAIEIIPDTICRFTGRCDKNGKKIWENDVLMCHGNSEDLAKAVFGEFGVRNIETGSIVDKVVGWHYEIIPTDAISRCEPFCWSMPLTEYYIDRCEMEVVGNIFDNKELLQEEHK
jgi:uncharacterized phage protein (TIGR01671 family)